MPVGCSAYADCLIHIVILLPALRTIGSASPDGGLVCARFIELEDSIALSANFHI